MELPDDGVLRSLVTCVGVLGAGAAPGGLDVLLRELALGDVTCPLLRVPVTLLKFNCERQGHFMARY